MVVKRGRFPVPKGVEVDLLQPWVLELSRYVSLLPLENPLDCLQVLGEYAR